MSESQNDKALKRQDTMTKDMKNVDLKAKWRKEKANKMGMDEKEGNSRRKYWMKKKLDNIKWSVSQ